MIKRIKAVSEVLTDGTVMVWLSPQRFIHYRDNEIIDASEIKGGKTIEQAHDYCDSHMQQQKLNLITSKRFVRSVTGDQ